jgi:hypothetical protein
MFRRFAAFVLFSFLAAPAFAVQSVSFKSTSQSSASGPPYPTTPVIVDLGRDIGGVATKTGSRRHRGFYIIDRTIPTAFEPGRFSDSSGTLDWANGTGIVVEHGVLEKRALSPIPAMSSLDVEIEIVDNAGVQGQFVEMPGLPASSYHQVTTTSTTVEFTYRVDLGDGGFTELTTQCASLTGYVLSNVQLTTIGIGSIFHLVLDLDGPGGDTTDPMLDCSTTGTFTESVVSTQNASWSGIKVVYR